MADIESETRPFVREFLKFLRKQIVSLQHMPDLVESIEVAVQCLEAVYHVSNDDNNDNEASNSMQNLLDQNEDIDLFELYKNAKLLITPERKEEAEIFKNEGNHLMKEEKYQEGLLMYSKAINIDARNPIFYCNRAAAWIRLGEYEKAITDANLSLRYNPKYCKAYARLGDAYSKINKLDLALDAYQNALKIQPDNQDYKNKLLVTEQRLQSEVTLNPLGNLPPPQSQDNAFNNLLNQGLMNMAAQMISDPSVQDVLSQLNDSNRIEAILQTGRQLAMHMGTQDPDLFSDIRRLLESSLNNPQNLVPQSSSQQQSPQNNDGRPKTPPPSSG